MAYLVSPYRPFHLSRLERRALRVHLSDQEDQGIRARPLHPIHPCWMSPSLQKKQSSIAVTSASLWTQRMKTKCQKRSEYKNGSAQMKSFHGSSIIVTWISSHIRSVHAMKR